MDQFAFEINLHLEENESKVCARLAPCFGGKEITRASLLALLDKHGYAEFYHLDTEIAKLLEANQELVEQCRKLLENFAQNPPADHANSTEAADAAPKTENEPLRILEEMGMEYPQFVVAERRDAQILIETDEADLQAYLTLLPAYGGKQADQKAVIQAIRQKGIKAGIIQAALATAIKRFNMEKKPVLIAKGQKPVKGKNSGFEYLVESVICQGPREDDRGKLNYLDVNEFVLVEAGTPLVRRTAPEPGKNGTDVYGRAIPAETGDLLPFDPEVTGAKVSEQDANLLIATQKGHPIILKAGVSIDPALELKNVSLATGNIDYDGSVHVKEDVADGMTIKASGEVIVNGVVGKATIIAGGNVIIDQGLIGGIQTKKVPQHNQFGAKICSNGHVSARFITCAQIQADCVSVMEYISHSDIDATNAVLLGQKRGNGQLIGGKTRAFNKVAAKTLGTKANIITTIRVGAAADTLPKLRHIMQNIKRLKDTRREINTSLNKLSTQAKLTALTDQQTELVAQYRQQLDDIDNEIAVFSSEERVLQGLLVKSKAATVTASKAIYSNVTVNILHTGKKVTEDRGRGTFRFLARKTVIEK